MGRDFWRAIKERHPFALIFARRPRDPHSTLHNNNENDKMTPRSGFPTSKLASIVPSKPRFSFLRRQSSTRTSTLQSPPSTSELLTSPTQTSEFAFRGDDFRIHHHNRHNHHHTFPRSHSSLSYTPRVYSHTPPLKLDNVSGSTTTTKNSVHRLSLPSTSAIHIPVSVESSSVATSTRISLISVAADMLALGRRLESALDGEEEKK